MGIRVNARVAALTRTNLVAHMIGEILGVFGETPENLQLIITGFQRELLDRVSLVMYDSSGEAIAYLDLKMDWERHRLIVQSDSREESVQVDPGASVIGQFAPALAKIVGYLAEVREQLPLDHCQAILYFASGKEEEAKGVLRTSDVPEKLWKDVEAAKKGHSVGGSDGKYPELRLDFWVRDPS